MFIKKDLRKLHDILADPEDCRETLLLARRSAEFKGSLRPLCSAANLAALSRLRTLTVYDNLLTSVDGVGLLGGGATPLVHLNLGRNQLRSLPQELAHVTTLQTLWADDNMLDDFPLAVTLLPELRELRLSGNKIAAVPDDIARLAPSLTTLALDNNALATVPPAIGKLRRLQSLLLRQNDLAELPDELGELQDLRALSISSNRISELPRALARLGALQALHANGNRIAVVPRELAALPRLKRLNLANNCIRVLPREWTDAWGGLNAATGRLGGMAEGEGEKGGVEVLLVGNPVGVEGGEGGQDVMEVE